MVLKGVIVTVIMQNYYLFVYFVSTYGTYDNLILIMSYTVHDYTIVCFTYLFAEHVLIFWMLFDRLAVDRYVLYYPIL